MAIMSRNIFVLFLLCVVLLIIIGVAFPVYLSRKTEKLRSTFNSSVISPNASSSEKLISENPESDIINTSGSTFLRISNEVATKVDVSHSTTNSSLMPVKVKRRSKRQISSGNDSELFDWNFNINVTRYRKENENPKNRNASVKRSGVAVYLESKEPKEIAFNEMEAAFKSVKSFFRDFYKVDFGIETNEEKKKVQYFTESPWVNPDHITFDSFDDSAKILSKRPDTEDNETNHSSNKSLQATEQTSTEDINELKSDSGSNDSSIQTDREGRIFFGIFNLGGKSLRKTTPEPETTLITDDSDRNIAIHENLPDPLPQEAMFVTANSQLSSTDTDSFKSETERSEINTQLKSEKSDLIFVTQQADCHSCSTDETENSNLNENDSSKITLETTSKPIEHLTDKTLRNLCIQILSNLKESLKPFDGEEMAFDNRLESSQNLSTDNVNSPFPNELEGLNTNIETGDNFSISSEESPTENTSLDKQPRFLSIFGLGSGRSETINEGNLIFEKEPDEPKFTNLPSVSDCEKFSEDWKVEMVPKRNLASDLNTTPDMNELLENTKEANENMKGGINADENETSFGTEVNLDDNKELREAKSENTNTGENVSSNELIESEIIDPKQNAQTETDVQRDGRIFSFFDFGSGNGRDANMTDRRRFFGFFSSGMRSLDSNESEESNDFGSGIPFQKEVSVDGDYPSEKDIYEDIVTSVQESRFLGVFGIGGSGEGREIAETTDSITEYNNQIDCENDCSYKAAEQPQKCDGCDLENYKITNSSADFSLTNTNDDCEGNCSTYIAEMHRKDIESLTSESTVLSSSVTSESLLTKIFENKDISNEVPDDECDDCDYENFKNLKPAIETEASSYIIGLTKQTENIYFDDDLDSQIYSHTDSENFGLEDVSTEKLDNEQNTENSVIEHGTTEKKNRRFMGTIFLTGSGDGGLFGDDGGPINLVQEENTIGSNRNPRRRGRLDDTDLGDYFDSVSQNPFDSSVEVPKSPSSNSQDLIPLIDKPKDSFITDNSGIENFSPVTYLPSPNITQIHIPIQPRSCSGARDCNNTLNERCITIKASSVCDCGRSFVRHKETGKCVGKRLVETSLKLPEESFDEDLKNPATPRYKQMSEKSLETIYLLLHETPNILRLVTDVNVAGFASGSLMVRLNFVLAAEKDPSQHIKEMESELQKALREENVLKRASLNVRDASFQPLRSEGNPCKSSDLNYCSKYAECIWNENYAEGFLCKCREHYLDVSTNSGYPGEICVAKCPASFCGTHGHCEVLGNAKRHCICYGLYFGEKCEYPGVVILGSVSIVALVSLIVVFVIILRLRCQSTSSGRTSTFRRADTPGHAIANCRVSDAIALGESREMKVSKFTHISTPVQAPPVIKITRPTLNESSISFDGDSTFDVSTTDEKV